jgi:hypothetical protein
MVFNVILMLVAGFVKLYIIDGPTGGDGKPFALAIYEVWPLTASLNKSRPFMMWLCTPSLWAGNV